MSDDDWFFGTDPEFLYRHDGPEASKHAAYAVDTSELEKMMLKAISSYGPHGCIADDLLSDHDYLPYSSVTARPSALERKGLIVRGPDHRIGKAGCPQIVMRRSKEADEILSRPPRPKKKRTRKAKPKKEAPPDDDRVPPPQS